MDTDRTTKLEFAVTVVQRKSKLHWRENQAGVWSVRIDVGKEEVLVEAALTSHEVQDLIESTGCRAGCGEHYNPYGRQHGAPQDPDSTVSLPSLRVGLHCIVLLQYLVKLGCWPCLCMCIYCSVLIGYRLACGIIARSAGLFQNAKQICECDG
ncbi:unnamed protein product, partial [Coregonus sp. 'balchen']